MSSIPYSEMFFFGTLFFYAVATVLFIVYACKNQPAWFGYFKQWLAVAVLAGGLGLIVRFRESGHLPLVTLFEITYFYAWMMSALYLFLVRIEVPRLVQGIALAIFDLILVWNLFMDRAIYPLNPMLNSFWLWIHVPAAMLGYSAFALSFAASIYYLVAEGMKWPREQIVKFNSFLTMAGFRLLGACIVTGAIWAQSAWGRFWSWDPKETWALVTFLIYGSAVLAGKVFKLNPKWQAVLSIVGFIAMLITFFGVAFFLHSHHSYQSGG